MTQTRRPTNVFAVTSRIGLRAIDTEWLNEHIRI